MIKYSFTLGMSAMIDRGFYYPSDTVVGKGGRLYVVNRSLETVDRGVRVTMCNLESEYFGTFGTYGDGDGQFVWPICGTVDGQGNIYVTDEYNHRVSVFDSDGKFLSKWGEHGSADGQIDGPSGIAIDSQGDVFVSDAHNNRVQKFSADGQFILAFDTGVGGERLSLPWGLTVAPSGDIYVADWGNDRIQRFSPDGTPAGIYGTSGRGDGEFQRPSGIAVDERGNMYVADWGNERVQVLGPEGAFAMKTRGEATLSKWAANFLRINNEEGEARARADLEPEIKFFDPDDAHEVSSHIEKLFWSPMSVKLDNAGRLYVTESNRHRIQIFQLQPPANA